MQKYTDLNGDSGVASFQIDHTSIKVCFKGGNKVYVYTYTKPGQEHVEKMKQLALSGDGLNSYITRIVKKNYDHVE